MNLELPHPKQPPFKFKERSLWRDKGSPNCLPCCKVALFQVAQKLVLQIPEGKNLDVRLSRNPKDFGLIEKKELPNTCLRIESPFTLSLGLKSNLSALHDLGWF